VQTVERRLKDALSEHRPWQKIAAGASFELEGDTCKRRRCTVDKTVDLQRPERGDFT
jgi:hypothetical protein